MTVAVAVDEDELSTSDSDNEDYLWLSRRRCRHSREESGDPPPRQLHRGTSSTLGSQASPRSRSAPPPSLTPDSHLQRLIVDNGGTPFLKTMLTAATHVDLTFDDGDWTAPQPSSKLYRAASVGNSWGVTSFGRGFNWKRHEDGTDSEAKPTAEPHIPASPSSSQGQNGQLSKARSAWASSPTVPPCSLAAPSPVPATPPSYAVHVPNGTFISGPFSRSPVQSRCSSPRPLSPLSGAIGSRRSPIVRSPSSPRLGNPLGGPHSRRRSSHQRVSLIAGRVSIVPSQPPSPPPTSPQKLVRANSTASFLSVASSTGPPTPSTDKNPSAGERSISEFVIEGEIGRGAYGLVKRAREMNLDGTLGVSSSFWHTAFQIT